MTRGAATRAEMPHAKKPANSMAPTKTTSSKSSKPPPPITQEDVDMDAKTLLFSMDYGTKTLSLAYRIDRSGEMPLPTNINDVRFDEIDYFVPQVAAWANDGAFFWGYQVDEAIDDKKIEQENVIELWKLLLYKDHQSSKLAERVDAQLGEHTLEELLSTHLKAVIEDAKDYLKRSPSVHHTAEDIDRLPMELFLSVPQMWEGPANLTMTNAVKAAGVQRVELVYEPQCAAAFYLYNHKDEIPRYLETHDVALVADVGGGTGDFVSYEVCQDIQTGAKVGLRLAKQGHGALCGSEFVNQNFIAWLMGQVKDFNAKCKHLGLTQRGCIRQASAQFESIKVSFTRPKGGSKFIVIRAPQDAMAKKWEVELTSETIAGFFEPVIQEIMQCIDQQLTVRTKVLLVPGGFGRSTYLIKRLKEKYKHLTVSGAFHTVVGAYTPVSRGALLRYKDIEDRGVPSEESFGIAQVERFNPYVHHDAVLCHNGDELPNGKICRNGPLPDNAVVEIDPFDGEKIVYERWVPIMEKGVPKVPGTIYRNEKWQLAFVRIGQEEINAQVYWTKRNIGEHEPIRQGKHGRTPLIKGIEPWGDELVMKLPDLAELGFEPLKSEKMGVVYEVYYRLVLECNGANIKVKGQIAMPGTQPYDENGEECDSNVELTDEQIFELCDASHNPFPRNNPN